MKKIFKVMILGDSGVGKTSILEQYVNKTFSGYYKVTIGADFLTKDLEVGENKLKLQIWDTAGQEKYQSVCVTYYRGADACLFVYDVTDKHSFANLNTWLETFKQQLPDQRVKDFPIVLVGNKIDKKTRHVTQEAAKKWCVEHGDIPYFEVSAKTRLNIDEAFMQIATLVAKKAEAEYRSL